MPGISHLTFIGAKYVVGLVDFFVLVLVNYLASAAVSLFAGCGMGETTGNLVGNALVMTVAIAFFISVILAEHFLAGGD